MRKSIALKALLRTPLKTLLTFFLIAAASFALFSRITDYAVTTRETENVKNLYDAVASLDNEIPGIPMIIALVDSPDGLHSANYDMTYEREDKPWLTEEEQEEFAALPGVTLADMSYMTAGRVDDFKRLDEEGEYGGFVVFEGTYKGYEEGESIPEDHVCLKFDDVKVLASEGGPEIEESLMTEPVALGETSYASSPYTRAFYDGLEIGSRCLVLAENSGYSYEESSGILFHPYLVGEGALRVLDGEPENYMETESFARQKGWADAINHNNYAYDIRYVSDMRAYGFSERSKAKGRILMTGDTDVCVVSEDFLKEYGLAIGDKIDIKLGNVLCHDKATAVMRTERGEVLDAQKVPEYVDSAELTIAGARPGISPNTIYVPSMLLPVDVPEDYEPLAEDFSVFVEDARDIETFYQAAEEFAEKVDLKLVFSDGGWLDVKDSFEMGAFTSFLTTVLYAMGAALALFLAVYLYIGQNKKSYAIMRMLGVSACAAEGSVVLPFVVVSVLAVPIGGIAGLFFAQENAKKALLRMADSAPAGYVMDVSFPVSVVILCLLSELMLVTLSAYFFLRKMKKRPPLELLQEGTRARRKTRSVSAIHGAAIQETEPVPVRLELLKNFAPGEWMPERKYGAVRHVASYIWRHMRRDIGKTAVSLLLAVVLAAGMGTLVLAKYTYRDAFYEYGVEGTANGFTFTSVMELLGSPLVKDFYCQESFNARVQDTELNVPMTITSDLMRELGNNCSVDYADGYDISIFDGTGQVCLVGKELADNLHLSLGDEIRIMSDFLYYTLKGENDKAALAEGYKAYKVVGIINSDEMSVREGVFVGIRSDLQKLFSMDFAMTNCEFTLADNEKMDELEALLEEKKNNSLGYSLDPDYRLDAGELANIERIRGLLEALFPIAVIADILIGLIGSLLVILQSAQETAFLRILGVTKKRTWSMLILEQVFLSIAGIVFVAGGLALYDPQRFMNGIRMFVICFGLYLLGCVCGAVMAAIQVTRGRMLELLQVKE